MDRRNFIQKTAAFTGGLLVPKLLTASFPALPAKSRIVISHNASWSRSVGTVDSDSMLKVLDKAIQTYFQVDHVRQGWSKIVRPGEVIGLKVNCLSGHGATHTLLVQAVAERLQQAGIKENDIIVWDRLNSDLEDGGFRINYGKKGLRVFGNDAIGFDPYLQTFGQASSLVTKILTRVVDGVINLPLLKDHSIAGITMSLKNLFGAINNPNKYHLNTGDPYIADVNRLPAIYHKVRFTICDAAQAQYHGGPSFMPQWRWPFGALIVGRDRVAMDYTGWKIIEQKRAKMGFKSLKEEGREPTYISTAADASHALGTNDPQRIDVIRV